MTRHSKKILPCVGSFIINVLAISGRAIFRPTEKRSKVLHAFWKVNLLLIVLAWFISVSQADTISYSDSFEASTINPFWTVTQQFGTVTLSTDQAHTGAQSAKFSSTQGGQREIHLVHNFGTALTGH